MIIYSFHLTGAFWHYYSWQRTEVGLCVLKMTSSTSPLNSEQKKKPKKWTVFGRTMLTFSTWSYLLVFVLFVLISGHFYFKYMKSQISDLIEKRQEVMMQMWQELHDGCLWPPLIPTRPGGAENRWVWLIRKQPRSSNKHRADTNHLSHHNCSQLLEWSLSPSFISEICPC